jgi:hypothetical protein
MAAPTPNPGVPSPVVSGLDVPSDVGGAAGDGVAVAVAVGVVTGVGVGAGVEVAVDGLVDDRIVILAVSFTAVSFTVNGVSIPAPS